MRILFAGLLVAFASQLATAAEQYGMAGCGLGSMMFGTDMQVSAATFNASGTQGFGISSGTSNCMEANQAAAVEAQQQFFANNLKVLSKEMAQGDGEYVKALAKTMGCTEQVQPVFASEMQRSYSYIFSAPGAMSMLNRVRSTIHEHQELNSNCNTVI